MSQAETVQDLGPFSARFEAEGWGNEGPPTMQALRAKAMQAAQTLGLPNKRTPGWEHTPTGPLSKMRPTPTSQGQLDPAVLERAAFQDESARLVFVDGTFAPRLSRLDDLPEGVELISIADSLGEADVQQALEDIQLTDFTTAVAVAFLQDGAFVRIAPGAIVEHPVHVIHVHTRPTSTTATVNVISAGANSKATVVESWVGSAPDTLSLHHSQITAAEGASIAHIKQQLENHQSVHNARIVGTAGKDATLTTFLWCDGGSWSRSSTDVHLAEPGSHCSVDGLWLGRGQQVHDCPTRIDHEAADTTSHELWKGIMDDESHGIFLGNVVVHQDAQRVDSTQTNRNLLLSNKAKVDTTPQLEIHADDVKCGHGSTIGRLDPEALFFLRARGIDPKRGELLLTKAFAGEVLSRVDSWGIRIRLERRLENWFERRQHQ